MRSVIKESARARLFRTSMRITRLLPSGLYRRLWNFPRSCHSDEWLAGYTADQELESAAFLTLPRRQSTIELLSLVYHGTIICAKKRKRLPGQSHLNNPSKNAQEIGVVPASLETFCLNANARRVFLAQQIEADVT